MTAGINRLNAMFRDFKVAEDVEKMIELRRFETEFEMYGTAYWENGQRHYLASKNISTILRQIRALEKAYKMPLPLQIWNEKSLVPAGWDEEIERTVKKHFCKNLHDTFPVDYWKDLSLVTKDICDDSGTIILDVLQEKLDGIFNADYLKLFEDLLHIVFVRRSITERSYTSYMYWLREMKQEMIEDAPEQDLFSKEFYGFAIQKEDQSIQVFANANLLSLYKKRQKYVVEDSCLVSPIFETKLWYNYDYRLAHARQNFTKKIKILYGQEYFSILKAVDDLPVAIDSNFFNERVVYYEEISETMGQVWKCAGKCLGIH